MKLASICLQFSLKITTCLSDFITSCYHKLEQDNAYDKEYYWNIICESVHRFYEDIHLVRSVVRNAYMGIDPGITSVTYSRSTICDHETMSQFVKYKFDEHLAMSTAITKLASSIFWKSIFPYFGQSEEEFFLRTLDHCFMKRVRISFTYIYVFKYLISCFDC